MPHAPVARPSPDAHPASARRGALLAFVASLLAAGCGQRGPLYLPENAPPPRRRRSGQQPAQAQTQAQQQQEPSQPAAQQQPQTPSP